MSLVCNLNGNDEDAGNNAKCHHHKHAYQHITSIQLVEHTGNKNVNIKHQMKSEQKTEQRLKDSKIPLYHIVLSIINNSLCFIMLVLWQLLLTLLFSHRHLDI